LVVAAMAAARRMAVAEALCRCRRPWMLLAVLFSRLESAPFALQLVEMRAQLCAKEERLQIVAAL
jgi:hypothetical protein